ncbi:MAG TPA: VOC family protein [Steroidobacteraceae bacterium]|nr:VOC family protein [Steroidobacteraceae bacterium]
MHLNHLHLSVPDVPALSSVLVRHFHFNLIHRSANQAFAALRDSDDFTLVLMRLETGADPSTVYPRDFHIGFLTSNDAEVEAMHASLLADGLQPSSIEVSRGGKRFYLRAPGALLIEVGVS